MVKKNKNRSQIFFEDEPPLESNEIFFACQNIIRAGIYLIEHGYGNMSIRPYTHDTGHWRCEFHPTGKPRETIFRYSSANGYKYLASHCGGSISPAIGSKKLAEAIMVGVTDFLKQESEGEVPSEYSTWLAILEEKLKQGGLPEAFAENTQDYSVWRVLTGETNTSPQSMPIPPGYVLPGQEPGWASDPYWREAHNLLEKIKESGATRLTLDLEKIEKIAFDGDGPAYKLLNAMLSIHNTEGWEGFKGAPRVMLALLANLAERKEEPCSSAPAENLFSNPIKISTSPPNDRLIRRSGRLLSMVHELHKVGYQRLRFSAGYSLDGTEWRCHILTADNVHVDGWTPISIDKTHLYTSVHEARYFGWADAEKDDARQLASKFIERFPETARAAAGQDWAYAGWLTSLMGWVENGRLPSFYGGQDIELNRPATPLPPAINKLEPEGGSGTGFRLTDTQTSILDTHKPNYLGSPTVVAGILQRFISEILVWVNKRSNGVMPADEMAELIYERSKEFSAIFSGEDANYLPVSGFNSREFGLGQGLKIDLGHYWQSQRAAFGDDPFRVMYAYIAWAVVDALGLGDDDMAAIKMGDRIQKVTRILTGTIKRL